MKLYALNNPKSAPFPDAQPCRRGDSPSAGSKQPASFFDRDPDLSDDLPSEGKLSQRKTSDCELTDTDETDAELGDIDDTEAELADGNDSLGNNRDTIGAVLKRDMQQGKP